MEKREISKKQFIIYLVSAFVIGWVLQIIASTVANFFSPIMMLCMFAPFAAVLIARIPLKGMGWAPHLKGKVRFVFFALWIPALLSLLAAGLFFLIFPQAYDSEYSVMRGVLEQANALAVLESQGVSIKTYLIVSSIQAVTYAPFINMLFALGEEVGWRGAMYPYLKDKLGVTKGRIVGGLIWGAWHWPVIILAGYEYGKEYLGAPVLGPIVFCISGALIGIMIDYVYDKTKCIWVPSLMHGAINAFTIFAYLIKEEYNNLTILGPMYNGLISMIPLLLFVIVISWKRKKAVD